LYEYYEYPGPHSVRKHRGIRTERYKFIHYYEDPQEFELYDLQNDPEERENLYGKPGTELLVKQLRQRLETRDPDLKWFDKARTGYSITWLSLLKGEAICC